MYVFINFQRKVSDLVSEVFQKLHQFYINSKNQLSKLRKKLKSKRTESIESKDYKIYFNNETKITWKDNMSIEDLVEDSKENLKTAFKIVFYKNKNFSNQKIISSDVILTKTFSLEEHFAKYLEPEEIEGNCSQDQCNNQQLTRQVFLEQCPRYLIVVLKRFENYGPDIRK